MTEVTLAELEACARLLHLPKSMLGLIDYKDHLLGLARAAKLMVNYASQTVHFYSIAGDRYTLGWPADGTESECILHAAAAVQIEREKQQ